jgi:hypothetical protein
MIVAAPHECKAETADLLFTDGGQHDFDLADD